MNTKILDKKLKEEKYYFLFILFMLFSSIFSLFGGIMEPDGALYASIAKNIVLNKDWINLEVRGHDWLDKPHLPFWLAAASFQLFGINDVAYKFPSLFFNWLGCYYLFALASSLYDRKSALITVLIYLTAFHIIISNFDVRAEIYLSTFTLAAVFHYYSAYKSAPFHMLAGSFFLACGVMVKGIFIVIPVFAGFILYWLFSKQYQELLKIKWWLAILLVGIFILPELYALYVQFDLHPEKTVFDKQGVSGIHFFFWDSQFGRFFNTGPIKGKGDPSFFLHTILWAFLPWSLLFYMAVVDRIKQRKNLRNVTATSIIYFQAIVAFLLFSLSKFQLPHYILVLFPHFALLVAQYLKGMNPKTLHIASIVQHVLFFLVTALLLVICFLFDFPRKELALALLFLGALICYLLFRKETLVYLIARNVGLSLLFTLFSYGFFYPALLQYQAGMRTGLWLQAHAPHRPLRAYEAYSFALDFYAPDKVVYMSDLSELKPQPMKPQLVFLSSSVLEEVKKKFEVKVLTEFSQYHITKLKLNFLNHQTRSSTLEKYALVEIQ